MRATALAARAPSVPSRPQPAVRYAGARVLLCASSDRATAPITATATDAAAGLLRSGAREAFESFGAVALESEGFVVPPAVKFPVQLRTRKAAYEELQTHGYEVDLIG